MGINQIRKTKNITLADFIIIDLLKLKSASTKELQKELFNYGIDISLRSITRHIQKIQDVFDVLIEKEYQYKTPSYKIANSEIIDEFFEMGKSTFTYYHLFNAILRNKKTANHIIIDSVNSKGLEYVEIILQAIEHKRILKLNIREFGASKTETVFVRPFLLKSYLNRWYIIGSKGKSNEIERFALYKIEKIHFTTNTFTMPDIDTVKEKYNQIIGITHYGDEQETPPKIVIEFLDNQFKYFETEPWIGKYKVEKISENGKNVIVSFNVHINNELHQRILFNNVKCRVLEPPELVNQIKDILNNTIKYY